MDKRKKNGNKREIEDMSAILEKKRSDLKEKLAKIGSNAPVLKTKNGMIELDPNNPRHKEWYQGDKYKGK